MRLELEAESKIGNYPYLWIMAADKGELDTSAAANDVGLYEPGHTSSTTDMAARNRIMRTIVIELDWWILFAVSENLPISSDSAPVSSASSSMLTDPSDQPALAAIASNNFRSTPNLNAIA